MNNYSGGRMVFDDHNDEPKKQQSNQEKKGAVDPAFQDEGLDFKFFNKEEYQKTQGATSSKTKALTPDPLHNFGNNGSKSSDPSSGTASASSLTSKATASANSSTSSASGTSASSGASAGSATSSTSNTKNSSSKYQAYQGRREFSAEDFESALKTNGSGTNKAKKDEENLTPEDQILYGRRKSFPWVTTIATLLLAAFSYASVSGLIYGIANADVYQILLNSATILIVVLLGKTLVTEILTLKLLKRREEKSLELETIEEEFFAKSKSTEDASHGSSVKDKEGKPLGGRQVFSEEDLKNISVSKEPRDAKLYNYLLKLIKELKLPANNPGVLAFHKKVNAYTTSQQMLELFEREILKPLDEQAQKIVRKYALRDLVVVSATNSHIFDMAFVFFRNLQMLQEITSLYGMKITYFSRLSLIKHIFVNIALTGAAEYLQEMGANFFSTSFLAKISTTLAQGLSVGLLTTRLGVRAIRFSRPLPFNYNDEPQVKYFFSEMVKESKELMRYGSDNDKKLP